jgi:hypothetical protein
MEAVLADRTAGAQASLVGVVRVDAYPLVRDLAAA